MNVAEIDHDDLPREADGPSIRERKARGRTSPLQGHPDLAEAVDRPRPIEVAKRVLAVPRLLEEGGQGRRVLPRNAQSVDGQPLELAWGQRILLRDAAGPEERAKALEAGQDHRAHFLTALDLQDRLPDGCRRDHAGRADRERLLPIGRVSLHPGPSEEVGEPRDRQEYRDEEEDLDGPGHGRGPDGREGPALGGRIRLRAGPFPCGLDGAGPREEDHDEDRYAEGAREDLPPGEPLRGGPDPRPVPEEQDRATEHDETEEDGQDLRHDGIGEVGFGWRGPACGRGLWDRLASRVEVGHVERQGGDEDDREGKEEGDRPGRLPPLEPEHTRTKAVAAHNDFPEAGKGSGHAKLLEEPLSPPDPHTLDDEGTC